MSLLTGFARFAGEWSGVNRLWLMPGDPVRESGSTATIAPVAGGGFATVHYTWTDQGRPHDGLIVVRLAPIAGAMDMVWLDSFHTGGEFMGLRRTEESDERIAALGSYPAPPGPDWGWRIALEAAPDGGLSILMYNRKPEGQEVRAVEATYTRGRAGRDGAAD
jgi:hypothetical protein